jgi:hypothetical protein
MAGVERRLQERQQPRRRTVRGIGDSAWAAVTEEVAESLREDDFSLLQPRHWVALYELMHVRVYGVAPAELVPKTRTLAAAAAKRLLDREFGGDRKQMAAYARWAWNRERGRHEWRVREGKPPTRMGWGLFFGGALVTDWRLDVLHRPAGR